jgi:Ni/Co efflux regulator RcnB
MKNLPLVAASLSLLALSCGYAAAQPRNDVPPMANHNWSKGERIGHDDWARSAPVDFRARHLRQPPHGYEWRDIDGRTILAAAASGAIADVVLNAR